MNYELATLRKFQYITIYNQSNPQGGMHLLAAVDYMGSIMRGWIPSLRHKLFLDENERSRASATDLSRLYRISNLGLLEENVEGPIIRWIQNNVFLANSYRIERR